MATSFSKIKSQIEKLQKRAASIQNVVIARIKKEIDKHGLSVGDLFGSSSDEPSGVRSRAAASKTSAKPKKAGAAKPAKFADGQGNTWHGIGKRPQWIHDALDAGKRLEDFLIGTNPQAASVSTKPAKTAPAAKKSAAAKKAAPVKAAPAKKAAKSTVAKKAVKTAATAAPVKAGKKAPSTTKAPAKKAPAKKAASKKTTRTAPQPASAAVDAAAAQS